MYMRRQSFSMFHALSPLRSGSKERIVAAVAATVGGVVPSPQPWRPSSVRTRAHTMLARPPMRRTNGSMLEIRRVAGSAAAFTSGERGAAERAMVRQKARRVQVIFECRYYTPAGSGVRSHDAFRECASGNRHPSKPARVDAAA